MSRVALTPKSFARGVIKLRLLWLILVAFFLLSGCVRYDVGVQFSDANHGKLVHHVRIAERSTSLESTLATVWLDRLEQRATRLGGQAQHPSSQELVVTIPFYNTKDLEAKFNQLFQAEFEPTIKKISRYQTEQLPTIASRLKTRSGNWVFSQRIYLDYELDLRSLNQLFATEKLSLNPQDLLDLEFNLTTPWGARSRVDAPTVRTKGRQLIWTLTPGEINHLEAIFWVPSPLGIGAGLIVLLVLGGAIAKAQSPSVLTSS